MDRILPDVADDDLRVGQRSLHGGFRTGFVVTGAIGCARAGRYVDQANLQVVKFPGLGSGRRKGEDVDDFLRLDHALKVCSQIVRVLENGSPSRVCEEMQAFVRFTAVAR